MTLNHTADVLRSHFPLQKTEIVLADWGSEIPLANVLTLNPSAKALLRIHYLPKEQTQKFNSPFPEVQALNAAARVSRGEWIGRIDQDTLIGTRFVGWLFSGKPSHDTAYFSGRRDMTVEQTAECAKDTIRYIAEMGEKISLNDPSYSTSQDGWWRSAVGILLIPRKVFFDLGGYDERNIYYNHMEHEFISRLGRVSEVKNIGPDLRVDFYHQFHPRRKGFKYNLYISSRESLKGKLRPNGETWGLLSRSRRINCSAQVSQGLLWLRRTLPTVWRVGSRVKSGVRTLTQRVSQK